VEAMSGGIAVRSGPVGSTFAFHVLFGAVTAAPAPSPGLARSIQLAEPFELSILLVEDNATNQAVALSLLKKLGQKPQLAVTGRQAVEMIAAGSFDLVFMDMQMPEMDGLEATKSVRKLSLRKQPRIIALTANAFEADRERCFGAGMDGFISKPFRLADLQREICEACHLCHSADVPNPGSKCR